MKRLRLLHTEASCGWGGQELRILAEAQGMIARGHEVWLAAPAQSRIYAEAAKRAIPATTLPIARKGLAGVCSLRALMLERRIALVNTHSSTDAWLVALAKLGLRGAPPMVRTRHISAPIPRNWASGWLYRSATAHVVTTGEALRAQVLRETGIAAARVTSVPTGIDLARFKPGTRNAVRAALGMPIDAFLVVIVATLRSWKGHGDLIDAVARLPQVHLAIVGDGPGREKIRGQVEALQLRERVTLAGQQEDVVPWMQAADVLALPSYANEGIPQALMQAMACGLPVVTTDIGAIGEIVRDGVEGLLTAPRNPQALAQAIERLRAEPALRARLATAGLAQARAKFSLERMLDAMEALFTSVLERSLPLRAGAPA
jgi:glycosyltransferase involved in cell wall biosynthesis